MNFEKTSKLIDDKITGEWGKSFNDVLISTQGMHGDLKGLIGISMPELPSSDFLSLDGTE